MQSKPDKYGGIERYEYQVHPMLHFTAEYYQYEYRLPDGRTFACKEKSLRDCRRRRTAWLKLQGIK